MFRAGGGTVQPRGGIMVVDDQGFDGLGDPGPLCQEVVRECSARGFTGAVLDFDAKLPPLERMAATLEEGFARPGLDPLCAGKLRSQASTGQSHDILRPYLEALWPFGWRRRPAALGRTGGSGAPEGGGGLYPAFIHRQRAPLTREELAQKRRQMNPSVFFSGELCARYFTYMNREGGAHFVLFDDG